MTAPPLFHLTCGHGRAGMGLRGVCRPNPHPEALVVQPWLTELVSWFTTDPDVDRHANGLASLTLSCDRTKYVYRVLSAARCEPWVGSRHRTPAAVAALEGPDQRPDLWWIATAPVPVRLVSVRP